MKKIELNTKSIRNNLLVRIVVGAFLGMLVAAALTPGLDAFPDDSMNDITFDVFFLLFLAFWMLTFVRVIAIAMCSLAAVGAMVAILGLFTYYDFIWVLIDTTSSEYRAGVPSALIGILQCDAGCGYARVESASRIAAVLLLWAASIFIWFIAQSKLARQLWQSMRSSLGK